MRLCEIVAGNIRARMAMLRLSGNDVYKSLGYTTSAGFNTRMRKPQGITLADLENIARALRTTPEALIEKGRN